MEISAKIKESIIKEIARLSMIIYEGVSPNECIALSMIINHLTAVLLDILTVSDFHEEIAVLPSKCREYYYELLFE